MSAVMPKETVLLKYSGALAKDTSDDAAGSRVLRLKIKFVV